MLKDKLIISAASTFGMLSLTAFAGDGEFYKYTNYNPDEPSSAPKYGEFLNPTGKSRPQTWWHWIDGNVSKEGIEADLKAMSENGYGAAIIFNISANCSNVMRSKTKPGPLVFNSPEWFETFKFAVDKGKEFGVDIGIHNCDGWSEAGGPWIAPEDSMKTLSWTGRCAVHMPYPKRAKPQKSVGRPTFPNRDVMLCMSLMRPYLPAFLMPIT